MWLFTEDGFFSAVEESRLEPYIGQISIRVRALEDLERIQKYFPGASPISETPKHVHADYRFRMWVPKEEFGAGLAGMGEAISYDNFKSQVGKRLGSKRESPLHRIWSIMGSLQKGGPYGWRNGNRREQLSLGPFTPETIDHLDFDVSDDLREGFSGGCPENWDPGAWEYCGHPECPFHGDLADDVRGYEQKRGGKTVRVRGYKRSRRG